MIESSSSKSALVNKPQVPTKVQSASIHGKSKSCFHPPRHVRKPRKKLPLGIVNAGNTCYANAILQALKAVPEFWSLHEEDPSHPTELALSFLELMSHQRTRKSRPEVACPFLNALKRRMSVPQAEFNYNHQHDAQGVLQVLLEDLKGVSAVAKEAIETKLQVTSVCTKCFSSSTIEDSHAMLSVPVASSIQDAIDKFLDDAPLTGNNKYNCLQCRKIRNGYQQTRITHAPMSLVIHIKRYISNDGKTRKDTSIINTFPKLLILRTVSDGLILNHSYRLRASINHQGTLVSGHYWSLVEHSRNSFVKCDDSRISNATLQELNSGSSYILFFTRAE